jgi:DNA-binding beta-propeller fold protein YncE
VPRVRAAGRTALLSTCLLLASCMPDLTTTQNKPLPQRAACYLAAGPSASALPGLASVPPRETSAPVGTILRVVATTKLNGAASATDIAVDNKRGRVYVLSSDGLLVTVDAKTNAAVGSLDVGDLADGLAVDPETGRAYVHVTRSTSGSGVGALAVIDTLANKVIATVDPTVAAAFAPGIVVLNERTGCLYAGDFSGKVAIVDVRTNAVQGTVDVQGQPVAIAVDTEANRVFVATAGPTSGLTILDGSNNVITRSFIGLETPRAIAVNPIGGHVYLSTDSDTLVILDGGTGLIRKTLPVMNRPDAITVDWVGNRIYVANAGAGTVTVIDGVRDEILGTATVAQALGGGIAVGISTTPNAQVATVRVYVEEHFTQPRTLKVFER